VITIDTTGGLLIAGGRSTRFGAEKAVALFDGAPMIDRVAQLFTDLPAFSISARPGSGAEARGREAGIEIVFDHPALPSGPLTGVLSGLAWARQRGFAYLASAPCDAPCLPGDLVARLAQSIGGARAAFAVTDAGPHPLCALWSVSVQPTLTAQLQAGRHPSVRAFLAEIGAVPVHFDETQAFANANTVEALAVLEGGA
jgi:molybdopterin-guanine dinucleotide biosynthesis protein A